MTQDEIIEMAKQADFEIESGMFDAKVVCVEGVSITRDLEAFAKLVAQHEREACAEICKKHADVYAKLEGNPTAKSAWAACIDNRDAILAKP